LFGGAYDSETNTWVYVNKSRSTEWDYDAKDKRAIVFSNHYIKNNSTAEDISNKLLNEFARLNFEKEIEIVGSPEVILGTFTKINSKFFSTNGIITSIVTRFGSSGLVTTIILDERCPRLFGFWSDVIEDDDDFRYVYSGLWGGGVYRKRLSSSIWESYNTGLTNLYVKDLYVNNGVLAIVLNDGKAYYRTIEDDAWTEIFPTNFTDDNSRVYNTQAECCTVDDSGNIIIIYNAEVENLGWIVYYNINEGVIRNEKISITFINEDEEEEIQEFIGHSIDTKNNITMIGGARIQETYEEVPVGDTGFPNLYTRNPTCGGTLVYYDYFSSSNRALTGLTQSNEDGSTEDIDVPYTSFYIPYLLGNLITEFNNGKGRIVGVSASSVSESGSNARLYIIDINVVDEEVVTTTNNYDLGVKIYPWQVNTGSFLFENNGTYYIISGNGTYVSTMTPPDYKAFVSEISQPSDDIYLGPILQGENSLGRFGSDLDDIEVFCNLTHPFENWTTTTVYVAPEGYIGHFSHAGVTNGDDFFRYWFLCKGRSCRRRFYKL